MGVSTRELASPSSGIKYTLFAAIQVLFLVSGTLCFFSLFIHAQPFTVTSMKYAVFINGLAVMNFVHTCVMCWCAAWLATRETPTVKLCWDKPSTAQSCLYVSLSYVWHSLFLYVTPVYVGLYGLPELLLEDTGLAGCPLWECMLSPWAVSWFFAAVMTGLHSLYCYLQVWRIFFTTQRNSAYLRTLMTTVWYGYLGVVGLFLMASIQAYARPHNAAAAADESFTILRYSCLVAAAWVAFARVALPYLAFERYPLMDAAGVNLCCDDISAYLLIEWLIAVLQTFSLLLQYLPWTQREIAVQ